MTARVAIVTGASSGIGAETARRLQAEGYTVYAAARRIELMAPLAEEGIRPVRVDVTDEASLTAFVSRVIDETGRVDILVNNAGTSLLRPLLEHTLADWQQVIDVNLTGAFLAARETARVMVAKRSGSIVNISSVFAQGATSEYPVVSYYASKGGVEGLTKALAVELGPHNVRVNAIAPGFFPSPMSTDMFAEGDLGDRLRREVLRPRTALPSLPRSADLRGAVRFLASDESSFVTGHTLVVDGGWRAF